MFLELEELFHSMYNSIKGFSTQQQIADAIKIVKNAKDQIDNPKVDITLIKPPSTNMNTKGRKSTKGVKSSTERLKIYKEKFEEAQQKNIKEKEKEDKKQEEYEKKKRMLDLEERHVALEQKKRKITILVKDNHGSLINHKSVTAEMPEIKTESTVYDQYDIPYINLTHAQIWTNSIISSIELLLTVMPKATLYSSI